MKTNWDDPRLTAYALGELDAADHAAVEALLAADPEARRWVAEVRRTAQRLETELQQEATPALTAEQTKAIEQKIQTPQEPGPRTPWWRRRYFPQLRWLEIGVTTACLLLVAAWILPALSRAKMKAQGSTRYALKELDMIPREALQSVKKAPADQTVLTITDSAGQQDTGGVYSQHIVGYVNLPSVQHQTKMDKSWSVSAGVRGYYNDGDVFGLPTSTPQFNTESYTHLTDNSFLNARNTPLSTFSIDVDTASYAVMRRFLTENHRLPPPDAVRIEELINYFGYDYPQPKGEDPFSVNIEIASCPWNSEHRLVRVGLKGREIQRAQRPPSNLVFLIDVSGSMDEPDKLPLLQESLKLLTRQLNENDHVTIVVYAGAAGLVLPETSGHDKATILDALDRLQAGGSTHGSAGIRLAYEIATEHFIPGGVNRVILCTDGDFNVGVTSPGDLTRLIEAKAQSGVFLSVLGFGTGNYKDSTMEMLADKGNGNYAYIDSLNEGRKVLVEQMSGTLVTIAKDVKIQIEFNPAQVDSYRLIGYENRLLAKEDFNNDKKDAGEIGAGHTVTALYEVVPAGMTPDHAPDVDPLKYQKPAAPANAPASDEMLTLKLRYKQPDGDTSRLLVVPVKDRDESYARASTDFKFAAAVAEFGMILRDSPYKGSATMTAVQQQVRDSLGKDAEGYRAEFLTLVETAGQLSQQ